MTGNFNLDASQTTANVTLIGNSQAGQVLRGGAGTDVLTAGNGAGDYLYGGSGVTTLTAGTGGDYLYAGSGTTSLTSGTGNDTMYGGSGSDTYKFGSSFGADVINNGTGSVARGTVNFTVSGVTDEKLWFVHSGNDLVVDQLGTTNKVTIAGWYNSAGNQVQTFTAGGLKLDSQIAQLV